MVGDDETVYIIQNSGGDVTDEDDWISPEPAEDVITTELVEATDLTADDIDELESYVDIETLRAVVSDREADGVSFSVEGHTVTMNRDGTVEIE